MKKLLSRRCFYCINQVLGSSALTLRIEKSSHAAHYSPQEDMPCVACLNFKTARETMYAYCVPFVRVWGQFRVCSEWWDSHVT